MHPCLPLLLAAAQAPVERPPNVVVLLADDLGFSDLGCYGGEIETPHLDALAAGGLRFTQFYNTGRCWPTRAALLTGYYAQQVRRDKLPGIRTGVGAGRPGWATLLPQLLAPAGYRSYHSGKWHVDGAVLDGGFERSYRMNDHDRFFAPRKHLEDDAALPAIEPGGDYYTTSAIADHAVRCLQDHARETPERPFLAYVAFTTPHFPLHARADDAAHYEGAYDAGWEVVRSSRAARQRRLGLLAPPLSPVERGVGPPYAFPKAIEALGPGEVNRPLPWLELTAEQREFQATKMELHAAMVHRLDQDIGRIVAQLEHMGVLEDTLVLFLSDNGASAEIMVRGDGHEPTARPGSGASYLCLGPGWSSAANAPFRRHKTWVHEGGIATPLIAHWPGGLSGAGELRHTPGHVIDLVPTLLELAALEPPATWSGGAVPPRPGRSLLPALPADVEVAREELWWSHDGHRALRVGRWKLVAARGEPWELFDLKADRSETRDLSVGLPERVSGMAERWEALQAEFVELVNE